MEVTGAAGTAGALKLLQNALDLRVVALGGKEHKLVAASLNSVAVALLRLGVYSIYTIYTIYTFPYTVVYVHAICIHIVYACMHSYACVYTFVCIHI